MSRTIGFVMWFVVAAVADRLFFLALWFPQSSKPKASVFIVLYLSMSLFDFCCCNCFICMSIRLDNELWKLWVDLWFLKASSFHQFFQPIQSITLNSNYREEAMIMFDCWSHLLSSKRLIVVAISFFVHRASLVHAAVQPFRSLFTDSVQEYIQNQAN